MSNPIKCLKPLGFPWVTQDPFLFCVFHQDAYPAGNEQLGPKTSLAGRNIGQDFISKDGWNMYHGTDVPGFPAHPHRGFETVTVVNKGFVDHADSLGAAGRFGEGDTQWMTAGKGVQHSEMFPLLKTERDNPFELFQIWLNLPQKSKLVEPHFKMLWSEAIPHVQNNGVNVQVVAGSLNGQQAAAPAPDSWAADNHNEVAIWNIEIPANNRWQLPACSQGVNRSLYFYLGDSLTVAGQLIDQHCAIELAPDEVVIVTHEKSVKLLLLQGRPIKEKVAQHGPFVMNTQAEIQQAFSDYSKDQFGGWPWETNDPNHGLDQERFARYADGTEEYP